MKESTSIRFGVMILAAGASRRMGRSKALLPWNGRSVIAAIAEGMRDAGAHQVAAVHAPGDAPLITELSRIRVDPIVNPAAPDADMFSSVCRGMDWSGWGADVTHLVIALCDMPAIAADTLRGLLAFSAAHPNDICQPMQSDKRGHPVVIPRLRIPSIVGGGHAHLRAALRRLPVRTYPTGDPAIHADADTPDAFQDLKRASPP